MISIKEIKKLCYITIGCLLFVVGINLFLTPANIFVTGIMGLSQELNEILNLFIKTPNLSSLLYFALNIPLIILGWFKVGKRFTLRTLFAVLVTTILSNIIPTNIQIVNDTLLSVIAGGIICGTGVGLVLKQAGSTGGTDILAMFLSLITKTSFGTYNLIFNSIVILIAIILKQDLTTGIYMIISLYATGVIIDKIHNYNEKVTLFIITNKSEEIRTTLLKNFIRGLTIFNSYGGYHLTDNNTIMMTIPKNDLVDIVSVIKNADEKAFINVYKVERIFGTFEQEYEKNL